MTSFFNTYDLRGKFPEQIDEEKAERVGKAYGSFTEAKKVLIGRDGRRHSEKIKEAFVKGIVSTGTDVVDAGMVPSPVIYLGVKEKGFISGAVVTASHNPAEYTGFKFCKENAVAMSRKGGMEQIQSLYESKNFEDGDGSVSVIDIKQDYIDFIERRIDLEESLSVVLNFGNGVTSVIGEELFEELGCEVKTINSTVDGDFPNHRPDPGDTEAQKHLESAMEDADLGIIFDGDGDRAGIFVPNHGYVKGDELLALLAEKSLEAKKGKVVHDLRASKLVPEIIEKNGGIADVTRVGHTFFSEEISKDDSIVFAGELSGHFYFPVFGVPWDDGLFSAALLAEIASEIDLKHKIESYTSYPVSPEIRLDCPEAKKDAVIEDIKQKYSDHDLSTIDGVKIIFEDGWALVRPSSTEEKISLRCEADTKESVESITSELKKMIKESVDS